MKFRVKRKYYMNECLGEEEGKVYEGLDEDGKVYKGLGEGCI